MPTAVEELVHIPGSNICFHGQDLRMQPTNTGDKHEPFSENEDASMKTWSNRLIRQLNGSGEASAICVTQLDT
jgi:hypothetical protein